MKKIALFPLVFLMVHFLNAQVSQNKYHIKNKVVVNCNDSQLVRLSLILPLAKSNQYQTVNNINIYDGEIIDVPGTDDAYIRWNLTENLPVAHKAKEIYYDFDVTLNPISFDFSQISEIYPYDTTSDVFKSNTGVRGAYIDPENPIIQNIGEKIWSQSSSILDYARLCYEYVACNYKYLNPYTGLHTLDEILEMGGGDCGNLTSIFISLLRYKNIPSRHIVTVKTDGDYHVWADFYLEKYGWIPVDVTFKNSDPDGDFFGKYDGNGIVMSKEVWLPIDKGDGDTYYDKILQGYRLWFWTKNKSEITSSHQFSSVLYQDNTDRQVVSEVNPESESVSN